MPKAQAAMERLMTMGYGLLTVLIVIGALAYFDILTPSKFIPEKCVLGGGLKCADYQLQFQKVTLKVENTLARDMVITKVKLLSKDLQDEGCSVDTNIALKPMTSADVEINNCAFTSAGKKKVTINVVYRYGSNIDHTQEGELVLQIDNPYTPTGTHADSCLDSDLGLVYYTEGTVSGWYNNEYYSIIDTCNLDGIQLNEYNCTGNYHESTSYECPNDCYFGHGVCKELDSCSDPDGSDFDTAGAATGFKDGYEFNNPDYCKDGTTLNESTCLDVSPAFTLHPCTYGCDQGKCNPAPGDSCSDPDGSDFDTAGAATGFKDGYEFNNPDYCKDGTTLNESTCLDVSPAFTLHPCSPDICLDGKCTAPTYSCTGTLTCTGLSQVNCQNCPVCSYTVESCSGTASSCSSYGTQGNCQLCGCSWAASTIQKVGGDVAGYVDKGTGSQAVSLPSGLQAGDIVIVVVSSDDILTNDGVQGQGYTNIPRGANELPGRKIAYKLMSLTPDSTVNIERVYNNRSAYVVQAWRGVDTTNVFDVATPAEATGTTGDPNAPAITPVTVGALVIAIGMQDDDDSTLATITHPTGYTNGVSANTGQVPASTVNGTTVAMASKTWSSGVEDPSVWVMSGTDYWAATTIALKPITGCSGTPNSCAIGTCEATCGCSYTASLCSNSGSCATCSVGDCDSCSAAGCTLS